VRNNRGGTLDEAITTDGAYKIVKQYAERIGLTIEGLGAHSLRATAATHALDHESSDREALRDCGRMVRFFESTDFFRMEPHDACPHTIRGTF
jgi:hypothetical protein